MLTYSNIERCIGTFSNDMAIFFNVLELLQLTIILEVYIPFNQRNADCSHIEVPSVTAPN